MCLGTVYFNTWTQHVQVFIASCAIISHAIPAAIFFYWYFSYLLVLLHKTFCLYSIAFFISISYSPILFYFYIFYNKCTFRAAPTISLCGWLCNDNKGCEWLCGDVLTAVFPNWTHYKQFPMYIYSFLQDSFPYLISVGWFCHDSTMFLSWFSGCVGPYGAQDCIDSVYNTQLDCVSYLKDFF